MTYLQTLSELLPKLPAIKIGYVGHYDRRLITHISEMIKDSDGTLIAFIYGDVPETHNENVTIKKMRDLQQSFRSVAREFEFFIIHQISQSIENRERLFKNSFKALENSGDLLVIEDEHMSETINTLLEQSGFVAVNAIACDDHMPFISAKKMHGWGHGL